MGDYWKCSRMGTLLCVYIDNQCTYFKNRDNMAYIAIYRASKPMSVVVVVVVVIKSQKTIGKKSPSLRDCMRNSFVPFPNSKIFS